LSIAEEGRPGATALEQRGRSGAGDLPRFEVGDSMKQTLVRHSPLSSRRVRRADHSPTAASSPLGIHNAPFHPTRRPQTAAGDTSPTGKFPAPIRNSWRFRPHCGIVTAGRSLASVRLHASIRRDGHATHATISTFNCHCCLRGFRRRHPRRFNLGRSRFVLATISRRKAALRPPALPSFVNRPGGTSP